MLFIPRRNPSVGQRDYPIDPIDIDQTTFDLTGFYIENGGGLHMILHRASRHHRHIQPITTGNQQK
jgi:hypothetical protein